MVAKMTKQKQIEILKSKIDQFPKFQLGNYPTPLYKTKNFNKSLGIKNLYIKRDDLSGFAFGGDGVRGLEFRIGDILDKKCNIFIDNENADSENSRFNAAASIKAGIKYVIITNKVLDNKNNKGNFFLRKLMNIDIHKLNNIDDNEISTYTNKLKNNYLKKGLKPYISKEECFVQYSSIIGYISGAIELYYQLSNSESEKTKIFQIDGDSVLGMAIVNKFCKLNWEINSFSPDSMSNSNIKNLNSYINKNISISKKLSEFLKLDLTLDKSDVNYDFDYSGHNYREPTQSSINSLKLLAKTESIFLDPIYTAKCMDGMIKYINENKYSDENNLVFIHSGGLPNLFTYSNELIK
jgi:1-aminocyclopropane-1-carboxylate deaminase/D-cysteine desulfhydrase-like pyridoxal-dependent ACC family enzyme